MPNCGPLEINSTHFASFHPHTFIKTHTFMYVSPTLPGMFAPKMCESKKQNFLMQYYWRMVPNIWMKKSWRHMPRMHHGGSCFLFKFELMFSSFIVRSLSFLICVPASIDSKMKNWSLGKQNKKDHVLQLAFWKAFKGLALKSFFVLNCTSQQCHYCFCDGLECFLILGILIFCTKRFFKVHKSI